VVSLMRGNTRAGAAGAVAAGALVLAVAISPMAFADSLVGPGTFDSDTQGWYAYGAASHAGGAYTDSGRLCADASAGGNAWDVAVQHDAVAFEAGVSYTISFEASATQDVGVMLQMGGDYPDVKQQTINLTTTTTSTSITFTPDFSAPAGKVGFQLGAQAAAYTFCLDNVAFGKSDVAVVEHSFAGGDLAAGAWNLYDATGGVGAASADGTETCIPLGGGYANPYDAGLTFEGVPVVKDANYVFSFTGHIAGDVPSVVINAKVGEKGGSWRDAVAGHPKLTTTPQTFSFPFTSAYDIPGTLQGGVIGRIAFELGTVSTPYTFCISHVSLVKTTAAPPAYAPETGPRVRVNQVGYLPNGPKQATLVTDATTALPWQLKNAAAQTVAEGVSTPAGTDTSAGLNVQVIDFGAYASAGTGYTLVADGETSRPFDIAADLYQKLRTDALDYFYLVRSGIAISDTIAPGYARAAGHVSTPDGGGVNKGDKNVTCLTQAEETATGKDWAYGDWTCPAGFTQDVVGGWYDAGDQGKYVVNGGIAVAQLMSTYERTLHAPTADAARLGDNTLAVPEHDDGVPDVLNEARWELEFLLSMQVPAGQELSGMAFHKIQDVTWTGLPLDPAKDPKERRLHRPSTAATLNLAAAAAQGARLFGQHDPTFATRLLAAARSAWAAAAAHPDLLAPPDTATTGNNGGGAYVDADVSDELYWAAAELYLTTGDAAYEQAVLTNPNNAVTNDATETFGPGGFSWGWTTALGRLDLATVPNALPGRAGIVTSVIDAADRYVAAQAGQPFGTTYAPKDGVYDWGSNSGVLNNDVVIATAFDLTGRASYRDAVLTSMDYLLGRNALNQSYVTGWGEVSTQHQHNRWFSLSTSGSSPTGALAGGPNSVKSTWDPTMAGTFTTGCSPQMCYLDDVQSWSTNEVAINWNSALSWVASFVADQASGEEASAGSAVKVTAQPAATTVASGSTATFTAAATGSPTPTVRWQSRTGSGAWADLSGTATTLSFTAQAADDGKEYRAVFTNAFGWFATDAARMSVDAPAPDPARVIVSSTTFTAGDDLTLGVTGMWPGELVEFTLHSTPVLLGSQVADASGAARMTVRIPADTPAGVHAVIAVGKQSGRESSVSVTLLAVPVSVLAAPSSAATVATGRSSVLAATGASGTGWLVGGVLVLLLAGSVVFGAARRLRE
jgi:endoglucanase